MSETVIVALGDSEKYETIYRGEIKRGNSSRNYCILQQTNQSPDSSTFLVVQEATVSEVIKGLETDLSDRKHRLQALMNEGESLKKRIQQIEALLDTFVCSQKTNGGE